MKDKKRVLTIGTFMVIFTFFYVIPFLLFQKLDYKGDSLGLPADIGEWLVAGVIGTYYFLPFPFAIPIGVSLVITFIVVRVTKRFI
jgi:hypothetical protein